MYRLTFFIIGLLVSLTSGVYDVCAQKSAEATTTLPATAEMGWQEYTFPEERFQEVEGFESEIHIPVAEGEVPVELSNPYTLGVDDVVTIEVMRNPEFTGDFVIGPDGNIQYSFVGDVKAAGLSKYELQRILQGMLRQYVRAPHVSVSIKEYRSKSVYIMGEVAHPGKYHLRGDGITLREAIIQSGLPTEIARLKSVKIVRPVEDDDPIVQDVDLKRILYKGNLGGNMNLQAGDIVVVNPTRFHKFMNFFNRLLAPVSKTASSLYLID